MIHLLNDRVHQPSTWQLIDVSLFLKSPPAEIKDLDSSLSHSLEGALIGDLLAWLGEFESFDELLGVVEGAEINGVKQWKLQEYAALGKIKRKEEKNEHFERATAWYEHEELEAQEKRRKLMMLHANLITLKGLKLAEEAEEGSGH